MEVFVFTWLLVCKWEIVSCSLHGSLLKVRLGVILSCDPDEDVGAKRREFSTTRLGESEEEETAMSPPTVRSVTRATCITVAAERVSGDTVSERLSRRWKRGLQVERKGFEAEEEVADKEAECKP